MAMRIFATSGGFHSGRPYEWRPGPLIDHALSLAGGGGRTKVCFLGTARGDDINGVGAFYKAFAGSGVAASHLQLFSMPNVADIRQHILTQDVIWVGGGSVANLLAVWRVHGLDEILREAWEANVLLAGVSAGSICWHVGGTTDSFGVDLRPVTNGLGFLPYGNGVHYDSEATRRPLLHKLVGNSTLPLSYATDDGVGILYEGTEFVEAVADKTGACAYRVERAPSGDVIETVIETRLLQSGR